MTTNAIVARERGWYYGWNIVAVCMVMQVVTNGLVISSFSLFLQDWAMNLSSAISSLQLGFVAMGLMNGLASVLVGVLADKVPASRLFCASLLLMAFAEIALSYVAGSGQLLLLFAIPIPLAVSLGTVPASVVVSRWFVQKRGLALGLNAFGLALAGIVVPPIVALLMPGAGWRTIWRASGLAILFIVIPIMLWVMRDRPTERDGFDYVSGDSAPPVPHGHGGGDTSGLTSRDVLRHRNFWMMVAVYLPITALYGVGLSNLAPIAATRGLTQQGAGLLLSIFSVAQAASTVLMGVLSDRIGNRLPLSGLAFATAAGGLILAFGSGSIALGSAVVLLGLGGGLWTLLAAATAREFGSAGFGRAFGMLFGFLPLIVVSPFLIAKVREITGSYVPSLLVLTALTLAGGTACLLMMRERRDTERT